MGISNKKTTKTMKLLAPVILAVASANLTKDGEWLAWKSTHGISFKTRAEETRRYGIFQTAKKFVTEHNARAAAGQETYTVALNKFSAMDNKEFASKYLTAKFDDPTVGIVMEYMCPVQFAYDGSEIPSAVSYVAGESATGDIRVTSVKDQGSCGSCWTFGAAAAVEAAVCATGAEDCSTWTGVSTQQLVDCSSYTPKSTDPNVINLNPYDNHGCSGGFPKNALRYVVMNEGIESWDNYGYVSGQTKTEGTCAYDPTKAIANPISTCGSPASGDETQMAQALAQVGPLAIGIDAGGLGFQMYSGGVYSSTTCSSTRLNHAVTAVGYGRYLDGQNYFEVKNSWGTGWGDAGYILIARDQGNMCGVATDTAYAIV